MAEQPPLMWRLIHVNLSEKKKNSKNFVSEHLQKKKLQAKAKWKRNKKATLQKQKQFASGQPCNGCNAPDRNKKQKQKKQQPTSWIAASHRKKQKKQQNDRSSRFQVADALSDFFPTVFIIPGKL